MANKLKPNKSMLSRFKVTKTGKLKRHHAKTSHLLSGRSGATKRRLGRPAITSEGMARRLRVFMGAGGLHPNKIVHERNLAARAAAKQPAEAGQA